MTDIVSVPTETSPQGPRHAGVPAALINAAWNQANTKFDLFSSNGARHQFRWNRMAGRCRSS